MSDKIDLKQRTSDAIEIILRWGRFEEAHHKQWALDQALRTLLGADYAARIASENADVDHEPWEEGTPP